MKRKVSLAIVAATILIASTLIGLYLESIPSSNPPLVYDFKSTISYDSQTGSYYGGSFLRWNTSGYVFNNETDAITIHFPGTLSRQFTALNSKVSVSLDWTIDATMVISRQSGGVYTDLTYSYESADTASYTNMTSFDVDNSTAFTVQFTVSAYSIAYVYRVRLWNAESS